MNPSYDHLRTLLRHVFEHPQGPRLRGMHAAAQERWTWDHAAPRITAQLGTITTYR